MGTATQPDPGLELLPQHEAELRESMSTLEQALAAPATDRKGVWAERVHVALVELSADFREHIEVTEGPDCPYTGVLTSAPHMSSPVAGLTREHIQIKAVTEQLLSLLSGLTASEDVDGGREPGTTLLGKLSRHRQRRR
jgi:hypothetical protein